MFNLGDKVWVVFEGEVLTGKICEVREHTRLEENSRLPSIPQYTYEVRITSEGDLKGEEFTVSTDSWDYCGAFPSEEVALGAARSVLAKQIEEAEADLRELGNKFSALGNRLESLSTPKGKKRSK